MDGATRFVFSRGFLTKDPEPTSNWLQELFLTEGTPASIQSDWGGDVANALFRGIKISCLTFSRALFFIYN